MFPKRIEITVLRHAKADNSHEGPSKHHPLSLDGVRQAMDRKHDCTQPFDLIMHSPTQRTKETAHLVAGLDNDSSLVEVGELFYADGSTTKEIVGAAFEKLGHARLTTYFAHPFVREALEHWSCDAALVIMSRLAKAKATNVLVVSHGVLVAALGRALTLSDKDFTDTVFGECQGFRVMYERRVEGLTIAHWLLK